MEIVIEGPQEAAARLSMILWGEAGSGKTTLASTMPGKKLWLQFDPDGVNPIRHFDNWSRIDMSGDMSVDLMRRYVDKPVPFDLDKHLEGFDTLVVDSLTKMSEHALAYACSQIPTSRSGFKPTIYQPGMEGYGLRNNIVGAFISNILRITSKMNKHLCLITHERDGERNDAGAVVSVAMMLGGQLPNITAKDISEVWHVRDYAGKHYIAFRPERLRSPMKTRMFDTSSDKTNFEWRFNATTGKGHRIDDWWEAWKAGKYQKLALPK